MNGVKRHPIVLNYMSRQTPNSKFLGSGWVPLAVILATAAIQFGLLLPLHSADLRWILLDDSERIDLRDSYLRFGIGDLNNDGFPDLLTRCPNEFCIIPNQEGSLLIKKPVTIAHNDLITLFILTDANSDGNLDIVFNSGDDIMCLLGNGDLSFSSEPIIAVANAHLFKGLGIQKQQADFDMDGLEDIVGVEYENGKQSDERIWFRSNGDGSYSYGDVIANRGERIIFTGDIDGDGAPDVAKYDFSESLYWHQNQSDGSFGRMENGEFPPHGTISANVGREMWAAFSDLDGDGLSDIVLNRKGEDGFDWFWIRNLSGGDFSGMMKIGQFDFGRNSSFAHKVDFIDYNQDGYVDILADSRSRVLLNSGGSEIWTEEKLSPSHPEGIRIDIDNDGDIDVIGHRATVFTNLGDWKYDRGRMADLPYIRSLHEIGNLAGEQVIFINNGIYADSALIRPIGSSFKEWEFIQSEDIGFSTVVQFDHGSDNKYVVSRGKETGYYDLDANALPVNYQPLTTYSLVPQQLVPVDLNGDLLHDLVGIWSYNRLRWLPRLPNGSFADTPVETPEVIGASKQMLPYDANNDGINETLLSREEGRIVAYRHFNGKLREMPVHENGFRFVFLSDIDGSEPLDLVVVNSDSPDAWPKLGWKPGVPGEQLFGEFEDFKLLQTNDSILPEEFVSLAKIDDDDRVDILLGVHTWYRGLGNGLFDGPLHVMAESRRIRSGPLIMNIDEDPEKEILYTAGDVEVWKELQVIDSVPVHAAPRIIEFSANSELSEYRKSPRLTIKVEDATTLYLETSTENDPTRVFLPVDTVEASFPFGSFGSRDTLIDTGAAWKYYFSSVPPPKDWWSVAFNDEDWNVGFTEIGYGEGDERSDLSNLLQIYPVTSYYRHEFFVDDLSKLTRIRGSLLADDGCAVYINGEIVKNWDLRWNAEHSEFARRSRTGANEGETRHFSISNLCNLKEGKNVIAVEVHQADDNENDLSFDLKLEAESQLITKTLPLQLVARNSNGEDRRAIDVTLYRLPSLYCSGNKTNWLMASGWFPGDPVRVQGFSGSEVLFSSGERLQPGNIFGYGRASFLGGERVWVAPVVGNNVGERIKGERATVFDAETTFIELSDSAIHYEVFDYDQDGDLDIITVDPGHALGFRVIGYLNEGNYTFSTGGVLTYSQFGLEDDLDPGDFDADGTLDFLIRDYDRATGEWSVYRAESTGALQFEEPKFLGTLGNDLAFVDWIRWNDDSYLDLVVTFAERAGSASGVGILLGGEQGLGEMEKIIENEEGLAAKNVHWSIDPNGESGALYAQFGDSIFWSTRGMWEANRIGRGSLKLGGELLPYTVEDWKAADFNGDGLRDVAMILSKANDNGSGRFFVSQMFAIDDVSLNSISDLTSVRFDASKLYPGDVNGDGVADAFLAGEWTHGWFIYSDGEELPTGPEMRSTFSERVVQPIAADIDGDGDMDFFSIREGVIDDSIHIQRNLSHDIPEVLEFEAVPYGDEWWKLQWMSTRSKRATLNGVEVELGGDRLIRLPVGETVELELEVSNVYGTDTRILHVDSDSDDDGLPDSWELKNLFSLDQLSDGDFDNDGLTNLREWTGRTNPAYRTSIENFEFGLQLRKIDNRMELHWRTDQGRLPVLQSTYSLENDDWAEVPLDSISRELGRFEIPPDSESRERYYRILGN